MEISELKTAIRKERGKGPSGRLRKRGYLPAVFYGPQAETIQLSISTADLLSLLKKKEEHVFIKLIIDQDGDPQERLSVIKELQVEPASGKLLHVDFYEIRMDHEIHFDIPLHFVGIPVGVEEEQGEILYLKRDLKVSCLPAKLPEFIEVNVESLHTGDALKVEDLVIDEAITILDHADTALATVVAPRVPVEAEAVEEQGAAPEVIRQKTTESEQ